MATNRQDYVSCHGVEQCRLDRCGTEYLPAQQECRRPSVAGDVGAGRRLSMSLVTMAAVLVVFLLV